MEPGPALTDATIDQLLQVLFASSTYLKASHKSFPDVFDVPLFITLIGFQNSTFKIVSLFLNLLIAFLL